MYETKESKTVSAWVTESDLVIGFGLGTIFSIDSMNFYKFDTKA